MAGVLTSTSSCLLIYLGMVLAHKDKDGLYSKLLYMFWKGVMIRLGDGKEIEGKNRRPFPRKTNVDPLIYKIYPDTARNLVQNHETY